MRILVLSPILPRPDATHGGAVYLGSLLGALVQRAEVALISFVRPSEIRWRDLPPAGLAQAHMVPLPQQYDLRGPAMLAHRARMLRRWTAGTPLVVAKHHAAEMVERIRRTCADFRPDVALIEFSIMAQYRSLFDCPTVITDHEHGAAPPVKIAPLGIGQARDRRLWRAYLRREYGAADLVQTLNEADADSLRQVLGRAVEVRPPVVPLPASAGPSADAPPRLLFLGDYLHQPNPEAAHYLVREVLPAVRAELPDAELWLAGPRAGDDIRALGNLPGVRVLGFVDDLADLFGQVRCLLAPLFSGGGTRIKVMSALAHGVPVITNALGRRGVAAPEPALRQGETTAELAAHALTILRDADAAAASGAAARQWAEGHLSPDALADQQIERFGRLIADRR